MNFRNLLVRTLIATTALFIGSQAFAARTTTYYHNDGLGSVVAATNDAGTVLWRKDYAPFGEQIDTTPDNERQSYTGKSHDDVTGLTYFGGRYYDPQVARFMSVDPVGFVDNNTMSFNRYLYVNNNPYKYVDPDGEFLNFVAKFVLDVGINVAFNYVTTGELNVGGALKESALGVLNPAKTMAKAGKLVMAMKKVDKVTPDAAGIAARSGKPFTKKGKAEVIEQNRKANGGRTVCEGCEKRTTPAKQSKRDVTPSPRETRVDHIDPKSLGGAGSPENGRVLCSECNLDRSNNLDWIPPKDR